MSEKDFLRYLTENERIIFKLVNIYARSEDDKQDLQQEIILQAWKSYPSFKGQSKFSTWLYRLALNTIFTMQRRQTNVEYREDLTMLQHTTVPYARSESTEALLIAIRCLEDTEKAIISLHLEGYSNEEIANIIGISLNNTTVKIFRTKQKLAQLLNKIT